ncbi:hypothetical protein [Mycoplasma elephantis]|uniref:hypothetical protein n=1 Tax=Mycoplasma elephantis TaxID=114882 RepID=UPI000483CC07|nr:hypothetical protein [Mycoplasma elephantis]
MHPRFDEEYNIEYVKLVSDNVIKEENLNIINSKLSWENIMSNELIRFKNNPNEENLLFKNKDDLFNDFEIFGVIPLSTVLQTTMMFVYQESNFNTNSILKVVKPENFPIPKTFSVSSFTEKDANMNTNLYKTNRKNIEKFFNKYQIIKDLNFVNLIPDFVNE